MQLQYSFDLKTCPLGTEVGRGFSHLIAVVGLRELVVKAERRGNLKKKKEASAEGVWRAWQKRSGKSWRLGVHLVQDAVS